MADKKSLQTIAAAVALALTSGAALAAIVPPGTKLAAKQEQATEDRQLDEQAQGFFQ